MKGFFHTHTHTPLCSIFDRHRLSFFFARPTFTHTLSLSYLYLTFFSNRWEDIPYFYLFIFTFSIFGHFYFYNPSSDAFNRCILAFLFFYFYFSSFLPRIIDSTQIQRNDLDFFKRGFFLAGWGKGSRSRL